ncbi:MAG: hypothetical protein H5U07_01500 [Candidatus Aminicenantes bacterium]|nr:hypothetical protein [Candidatus Aminicenantes bacterium]
MQLPSVSLALALVLFLTIKGQVFSQNSLPSLADNVKIFFSPSNPVRQGEIRVIVVADEPVSRAKYSVRLRGEDSSINLTLFRQGGGPPFWQWWQGQVRGKTPLRLEILDSRKKIVFSQVLTEEKNIRTGGDSSYWQAKESWDHSWENLFSAWVEALFQDSGENDSWPRLDLVLKDEKRNFLYNHLSLSEEVERLLLKPDCADNPFFLRGYFAWKCRLPFGFHECSRGALGRPPTSGRWFTNEMPAGTGNELQKFVRLMHQVMNSVHSGTARTSLAEDFTDYYPLTLKREYLKPGTVFADPYGHTLMLVRWIGQTEKRPGVLLAVDAQPDGTIGIKRFWKGNFIFVTESVVGEPGFKAFRPIEKVNGQLRLKSNEELISSGTSWGFSLEQFKTPAEIFYERMDELINPSPLDPEIALRELYRALHELLLVRVQAVEMAEKFKREHPGYIIPMPDGPAAFISIGPWEEYSTPNRDLRLLIAMDTVKEFIGKVMKRPERYKIKKGESLTDIKKRLEDLSLKLADKLSIVYRRSDGSPWKLTVKEILEREEALEMGYNPNDCAEVRWGAPAGSEEISSCRGRAPRNQLEKMEKLRIWFKKRLHPPT